MLRHLALRVGTLAAAVLLLGVARSATAGTVTGTTCLANREGCMRFLETDTRGEAALPEAGAPRLEEEKLAASRNPNYPAAFVFETHSASYLASAPSESNAAIVRSRTSG